MPHIVHPFPPVFDRHARVLILGTLPSAASREDGFYYGHPRNRFWPLLAALFGEPLPADTAAKRNFLLRHGLALWDVLQSCEIDGSSDASIRAPLLNDFSPIFDASPHIRVYANGQTSARLYRTLCAQRSAYPITALPSTSPANAGWTFDRLRDAWSVVAE